MEPAAGKSAQQEDVEDQRRGHEDYRLPPVDVAKQQRGRSEGHVDQLPGCL